MTEPQPTAAPAPRAETPRDARLDREAAALRDNLRRRKQQARARAEPSAPPFGADQAPPGPAEG